MVRVVARGVQDGDTDEAGGVDCIYITKAGNTLAIILSWPIYNIVIDVSKDSQAHAALSHANILHVDGVGKGYVYVPFGCHTSPENRIVGGFSG